MPYLHILLSLIMSYRRLPLLLLYPFFPGHLFFFLFLLFISQSLLSQSFAHLSVLSLIPPSSLPFLFSSPFLITLLSSSYPSTPSRIHPNCYVLLECISVHLLPPTCPTPPRTCHETQSSPVCKSGVRQTRVHRSGLESCQVRPEPFLSSCAFVRRAII